MVPDPLITRRRLLHGVAAGLAAVAGCNTTPTPPPRHPNEPDRPANLATDLPHRMVRNPDGDAFVALASERSADGPTHARGPVLVDDDETAERLRFTADVDGTDAAREFVAATDFSRETVYVLHYSIDACRRLTLCYVTWSESEIDVRFGRAYRPPDVACDVDDRDVIAVFVRIPAVIESGSLNGHGAGSGPRCRLPPEWRTSTSTATPTSATPQGRNDP
jgi:hypothetical protein